MIFFKDGIPIGDSHSGVEWSVESGFSGVPGGNLIQGSADAVVQAGQPVGTGCRVQGAGCRVQSTGYRVQSAEYRVHGTGYRVQSL